MTHLFPNFIYVLFIESIIPSIYSRPVPSVTPSAVPPSASIPRTERFHELDLTLRFRQINYYTWEKIGRSMLNVHSVVTLISEFVSKLDLGDVTTISLV